MQVSRNIAKGQLVPLKFMQDAVAASQTDAALEHENGQLVVRMPMPFDGEIVAVSAEVNAAATAGSATVQAAVDGTGDADAEVALTTGTDGYQRVARGKATFKAGQSVGALLTTTADWDGTTSDLVAVVWVLLHLEGI